MSEPKFTPGPWYAIPKGTSPEERCAMYRIDKNPNTDWGNFGQIAYAHKNDAHLISAAPDMYAELFNAAQTFAIYAAHHIAKGDMEKADKNLALVGRINDVLIKARGEG